MVIIHDQTETLNIKIYDQMTMTLTDIKEHVHSEINSINETLEFDVTHEGTQYHVYLELYCDVWNDKKHDQLVVSVIRVVSCGVFANDSDENITWMEENVSEIVETI